MAELADALDLGSSPERGGGSNPSSRINCAIEIKVYGGKLELYSRKEVINYLKLTDFGIHDYGKH